MKPLTMSEERVQPSEAIKHLEDRLSATLQHFDNAFCAQMHSMLGLIERDSAMKQENRILRAVMGRDERQQIVSQWCEEAFGADQAGSVPQRGMRLLEEAIEAYQACGCEEAMAHKLVAYVFSRPPGAISQELGGVGVTVLALAEAAGFSADDAEHAEVKRVISKPIGYFTARNAAKNAAGFEATAADGSEGRKP